MAATFDPKPLRRARRERELTLDEVGFLVGRHGSVVCRYERGYTRPDPIVLDRWLSALDVNLTDVCPDTSP